MTQSLHRVHTNCEIYYEIQIYGILYICSRMGLNTETDSKGYGGLLFCFGTEFFEV